MTARTERQDKARLRLREILEQSEKIRLAEAALWIAASEYPDLDPAKYIHRLDAMAETVRGRIGSETDPFARVVVPDHKRLRPGTLRQILRPAGLTVDQLHDLLRGPADGRENARFLTW